MANDWIKMRAALVNHPKVIAMSRALLADNDFRHWLTPGGGPANGQIVSTHALRCVTTSLLMCVWSVAREHGKFVGDDLHLPHSKLSDLDEVAGAPGIGQAMAAVKWVEQADGLWLRNFIEFNVPMTNAEKQAEYRRRKKALEDALLSGGNEEGQNVTTREKKRRSSIKKEKKKKSGAGDKSCTAASPAKHVGESPLETEVNRILHVYNLGQISEQQRDQQIEEAKAKHGLNGVKAASTDETTSADSSKPAKGAGHLQTEIRA